MKVIATAKIIAVRTTALLVLDKARGAISTSRDRGLGGCRRGEVMRLDLAADGNKHATAGSDQQYAKMPNRRLTAGPERYGLESIATSLGFRPTDLVGRTGDRGSASGAQPARHGSAGRPSAGPAA
jgi:hypothetical protein